MLISDVSTLAFVFLALFITHQFEEIVFMHYWLEKHQSEPAYQRDFWVSQYTRYPATRSAFALMISEEFVLATMILLIAILIDSVEMTVGLFLANMLHLTAHLIAARGIGKWSPGSVTALITLLLSAWIVWSTTAARPVNFATAVIAAVIFIVLIAGNLLLLHYYSPRIEQFITAYVKRLY